MIAVKSRDQITLTDDEQEVALAEVEAVLESCPAGSFHTRLQQLTAQLHEGSVSGEALAELDRLLEISLQSGRLRAHYGPGGEAAALRLYRKLPSGRALADSAREVSTALDALNGRTLTSVAITVNGPGTFALRLSCDGLDLALRLDRQGARLTTVEA